MTGWVTPAGHHVQRVRRNGSYRCMTTDQLMSQCPSCRETYPFKRAKPEPVKPLVWVSIPKFHGKKRHEVIYEGGLSTSYGDRPGDCFYKARCGYYGIGQLERSPEAVVTCPDCIIKRRLGRVSGPPRYAYQVL